MYWTNLSRYGTNPILDRRVQLPHVSITVTPGEDRTISCASGSMTKWVLLPLWTTPAISTGVSAALS